MYERYNKSKPKSK